MSFPNIPNITPLISVTIGQTVPLLLSSIALEELALAHIMNAEAENLQFVLGTLDTDVTLTPAEVSLADLLEINSNVQRTLRDVIKKEMLLEFKFENVLDLIASLPEPPICPDSVTLSNGSTVRFTGLTDGGLTWNYEILNPPTPSTYNFGLYFPCAITNFVSCTSNPPGLCDPLFSVNCVVEPQEGMVFTIFTTNQAINTFSFTLNQQFPIGTIGAFLLSGTEPMCFEICGPICS